MKSTQPGAIASAAKPGRTGFQIERRKLAISILLGLMGFAGSFYSLNFGNPPFVISIDWCIFPPLLAGLAFGGRYGFIAATLGLGALYPLFLWPNNGWAAVVTSLLLVLYHSASGYFTGLRQKRPAFWNHPWFFYPLSVLAFNLATRAFLPIAFSLNPPFWYPAAELSMPLPVLDAIAVKGTVILFVIVIFDAYLLKLPPIRKLLGLEIKKESRQNGRIALGIFLGSVLVWWVFILFNRILVDHTFPQGLFRPNEPRETIALLVFLAAGIVIGSVVVHYAQSRLKAEDALSESEERFRLIAENSTDLISRHTPEGVYLYASPACRHMLGYEPEELVAHSAFEFIHPDDLPKIEQSRQRVVKTPVVSRVTYRIRRKQGDYLWLESTSHFIPGKRSGETAEIQVASRDITDRKQAEEKVAASQKLLQDLTDSSQSLVYALDAAGRYLLINRGLESVFGVPRETLIGKTRAGILPPEVAAAHRANDLQVIGDRKPITFEEENHEPDGKHTYLSVKFPLLDWQGEVYGLGGISTDITDRKRAELLIQAQQEQLVAQNEELAARNAELVTQARALEVAETELRRMNNELEQRIQARSTQLSAANAELQLANAAILRAGRLKDEFLANMSHELRTPLTGILGLAEVMDKGIYGGLNDKQRQALNMIQDSGEHLLQLINDILDLSKIEAGKVELQIGPVAANEVCQASLEFVTQTAHKKNLKLFFQSNTQVHQVQADERRLKQMLVNLLSNAVKFTPEGGQVGLEVAGDPVRQQIRFTVWDTGIGIVPEQQALLFQPFIQLDGSLARKYEGTGLGLALVHSMAQLHGGSVTVESAGLGQGARFTLTLPWEPQPVSPAPAATDTAEPISGLGSLAARLGRPPVILAADDNPTILMVLTDFLEAIECQVIIAQNGTEALAQAQATRPDLILLDIHMPDMDGLTVIRRLRAAGSVVPVIALTALAMLEDQKLCLAAGADDYLSKPVSLNELTRVIARHLKLRER